MRAVPRRDTVVRLLTRLGGLPAPGSLGQRLGAAALAAVAAGSLATVVVDRVTALPSDAVFRFADEVMTNQGFDRRLHLLTAMYGVQEPADPAAQDQFRRDAAKAVAVTDIVDAAARERNIVVADKAAQDKLDTVIAQSPGGRDAFISQLGTLGLSQGDLLAEIKRTVASSQLFDQVTKDTPVTTEDQAKKYYAAHTADMAVPETRHLRNIVVADQGAAQDVLKNAQSGTDFATLAAQKSLDQSTKDKGGDLGSVSAALLEKAFADAAFGAARGSFFGPVQTKYGWNVGQVVDITPAQPRTFDQVKDQLMAEMQLSAKLAVWRTWLTDRITSADVEYAEQYRPADPDSPPADLGTR